MASGNAIVARLGLDTKGFNRDLAAAEREAQRVTRRMNTARGKLLGSISGKGGLAKDIGEAFGLPIGAAAGAFAGVSLVTRLMEIKEQAAKAREELAELLRPAQAPDFSALEDLETRVSGLNKLLEETKKKPGFWEDLLATFSQGLDEMFGGTSDRPDAGADSLAALKQRQEIFEKIAEKARAQTKVTALQNAGEEERAELEKLHLEYAEKLGGAIKAQNAPLYEALKAQEQEARLAIENKYAEKEEQEQKKKNEEESNQRKEKARTLSEAIASAAERAARAANQELNTEHEMANVRSQQAGDAHDHAVARAQAAAGAANNFAQAQQAAFGNAREAFINTELGGPDARRAARRAARDRRRAGAKFDRLHKGLEGNVGVPILTPFGALPFIAPLPGGGSSPFKAALDESTVLKQIEQNTREFAPKNL